MLSYRHDKKALKVYINNHMIFEYPGVPYVYPGNLEHPVMFQVSAIDKSISQITVFKGTMTDAELSQIYDYGEMVDDSPSLLKDHKKRLICKFPD